jgi:two-component system, NarL family, sensor histidine kinase UhpB
MLRFFVENARKFENMAVRRVAQAQNLYSVVETTDDKAGKRQNIKREELNCNPAFQHAEKNIATEPERKEAPAMQELNKPYTGAGQSFHASNPARPYPHSYPKARLVPGKFGRRPLFQQIFVSNVVIILGGAIVGSWLSAQLAEAGKFNFVTFSIIIFSAVLFSSAVSFVLLKLALRPFTELQRVLAKVHEGNPRARYSLEQINNPDVKQFTHALNQMLVRLEDNARVIQQDQQQLQLMTAQVITAQENERKRISRELHDEASQSLTAMIMGLEAARNNADGNPALQTQLGSLKELAASTLEELRKLALDLRPTMLDDLGLVPAVRWLSRTATERANFEVKLDLSGFNEQERLAPELETCLFRITQESLTNITKHAHASRVEIRLERFVDGDGKPEKVKLTVADNGRGFDRAAARAKAYRGGHLGLFDIEERATLLGGKVEILTGAATAQGCGTQITVWLPVQSPVPLEPAAAINTHRPPYTL